MADDESGWLPKPPPPRPAAREDAVHAALRKFDSGEEPARPPKIERPVWRRPQFAVAMSAMLLVVVGIPAALIGLRNQEAPPPEALPKVRYEAPSAAPMNMVPPPPARAESDAAVETEAAPAAPAEKRAAPLGFAANDAPAAQSEAPEVAAAAPPPPPPPPPPAPAPMVASADSVAQESAAQDVVVTGTLLRSNRAARAEREAVAKARPDNREYRTFLARLQGAVRSNDKSAIIGLISFPLRVNYKSGARSYRDARAMERDFDRIFTSQVRHAVLNQSPDQIFSRDIGAMVGDGELWFDRTAPGQVRIIAVNP